MHGVLRAIKSLWATNTADASIALQQETFSKQQARPKDSAADASSLSAKCHGPFEVQAVCPKDIDIDNTALGFTNGATHHMVHCCTDDTATTEEEVVQEVLNMLPCTKQNGLAIVPDFQEVRCARVEQRSRKGANSTERNRSTYSTKISSRLL